MVIHEIYMPFEEDTVKEHFLKDADASIRKFMESAERYEKFLRENPTPVGMGLKKMKVPCQMQKDETFWTAACLMAYYHSEDPAGNFEKLLSHIFGEKPAISDLPSWQECLKGDLKLYFEVGIPSPKGYKNWLRKRYEEWLKEGSNEPHLIPYVLWAAQNEGGGVREHLEGSTKVDAILLNETNGFAVFLEAKVLSDISYDVRYDARRNQLERVIDVMLEPRDDKQEEVSCIRPDRSLFVLLTPEMFKQNPESRLYGFLIRQYKDDRMAALACDIPHRSSADLKNVSLRLGWLTWEDCDRILPGSCRWLTNTGT